MSVKENWKQTGTELGKTFAGLGETIVKTIEVGAEMSPDGKVRDENGNVVDTGLKEQWEQVGQNFVRSGIVLGKATASTAKVVIDKVAEIKEQCENKKAAEETAVEETTATEEAPAEENKEEGNA